MPKCLMIADDLTGANGSGVLIKKLGLDVMTVMNPEKISSEQLKRYDTVVCPTDSRGVEPGIAYDRVKHVMNTLGSDEIRLYSKRIDSTFRGNIGREIDAMLDCLPSETVAVVVPVFPSAGRVCCGGYLLVGGVMLQDTDAGKDPKAPVSTSNVEELLAKQTKRGVRPIKMEIVRKGEAAISETIREGAADGVKMFIVDGINDNDILTIAQGCIQSGIPFITADPGPFTAAVLQKVAVPAATPKNNKILMIVGSVTNITRTQMDYFIDTKKPYFTHLNVEKLLESRESYLAESKRVLDLLQRNVKDNQHLLLMLTSINSEMRVDFVKTAERMRTTPEAVSLYVNDAMAEITAELLGKNEEIKGIYSSGGDITVALCKILGASGLELIGEVIPLAAYGKLAGGKKPGVSIVTKGGMVGDRTAAVQCVDFITNRLSV